MRSFTLRASRPPRALRSSSTSRAARALRAARSLHVARALHVPRRFPAALASGRAPRPAAWAAAAAALVLLAACGTAASSAPSSGATGPQAKAAAVTSSGPVSLSASPTQAGSAQAPAGQHCDPRQIGPIAASFVSASDGFLLGITLSDCQGSTASKIVARKTADGGLHWTALPAPPAPWGGVAPDATGRIPADGVTSVLFADARNGWAYGPGLWATHDGGVSWHRIATGGRAVQRMAASGGQVIASLASCDPIGASCDGPQSWVVETSSASRDAWRPVPGAAGGPVVAAQAGTGYAVAATTGAPGTWDALLTGPVDGSARWTSRPLPCHQGAVALAAVTTARLVLACALLGAHPATTYLYSSSDAGVRWQRFAVLGLFDGASTIQQAPGGTVLVAGIYDGIGLSRDGGRTWTRPAVVDDSGFIQGGGSLEADLFTSQDGYVISWLGPLWITGDAGRTWTQVPVR